MMNVKRRVTLAGGVVGLLAAGAHGQVFAQAEATVLVEYLNVREITNGTPVGPTGLDWNFWMMGGGRGRVEPWQSLGGTAGSIPGPPIAGPGLHAPSPNTGYSNGLMLDYVLSPNGFGARGEYTSTTINYSNTTNGHSLWEIDGEVSINLSLASDMTDPERENVIVSGHVKVLMLDENGISFFESVALNISGANGFISESRTAIPFSIRIGNIGSGYRRDFAEIRIDIDLLASMHAVPAPSAITLMSMAGLLATRRRRN